MKKRICGLVLLAAGIWFFSAGWSRKDSLLGALAETGASIANKFDGGSRTPKHYVFLGGGVLLGIVGGLLLFSRKKAE